MNRNHVAALALLLATSAACAPLRPGDTAGGVSFDSGAVVLTGAALEDGPGSVLAAMAGKVPNFRLQRLSGECPIVSLRSHVSYLSVANPHVYVDGTRATDTCILESLRTVDVERVEVYPQGFTTRPGYRSHAHGLILVFMRSAISTRF